MKPYTITNVQIETRMTKERDSLKRSAKSKKSKEKNKYSAAQVGESPQIKTSKSVKQLKAYSDTNTPELNKGRNRYQAVSSEQNTNGIAISGGLTKERKKMFDIIGSRSRDRRSRSHGRDRSRSRSQTKSVKSYKSGKSKRSRKSRKQQARQRNKSESDNSLEQATLQGQNINMVFKKKQRAYPQNRASKSFAQTPDRRRTSKKSPRSRSASRENYPL